VYSDNSTSSCSYYAMDNTNLEHLPGGH
jgi:hypothetical protein